MDDKLNCIEQEFAYDFGGFSIGSDSPLQNICKLVNENHMGKVKVSKVTNYDTYLERRCHSVSVNIMAKNVLVLSASVKNIIEKVNKLDPLI